ncbi:MAG: ferredoxin--NADP reductase [bacterium]|nr:ferredoxin--NADP reductase [bacterium]
MDSDPEGITHNKLNIQAAMTSLQSNAPALHNASIVYREDINEELFIIRVAPLEGLVPDFIPGQFAEIGLVPEEAWTLDENLQKKSLIRRAYSIASAPSIRSYLELYIVKVDGGQLTERLHKLQVGDSLFLAETAKGKFTLDEAPQDTNLLLIGTGTGLAPFMSMLREFHAQGRWKSITLMHGVRLAQDLGYREEIEKFVSSSNNVFYIPSTTRENIKSCPPYQGRIPDIIKAGVFEQTTGMSLDPKTCHVFICGNPQMIDSVQTLLEEKGFSLHKKKEPGNIHAERYW